MSHNTPSRSSSSSSPTSRSSITSSREVPPQSDPFVSTSTTSSRLTASRTTSLSTSDTAIQQTLSYTSPLPTLSSRPPNPSSADTPSSTSVWSQPTSASDRLASQLFTSASWSASTPPDTQTPTSSILTETITSDTSGSRASLDSSALSSAAQSTTETLNTTDSSIDGGPRISLPTAIGVLVVIVVLLIFASSVAFICVRRRRRSPTRCTRAYAAENCISGHTLDASTRRFAASTYSPREAGYAYITGGPVAFSSPIRKRLDDGQHLASVQEETGSLRTQSSSGTLGTALPVVDMRNIVTVQAPPQASGSRIIVSAAYATPQDSVASSARQLAIEDIIPDKVSDNAASGYEVDAAENDTSARPDSSLDVMDRIPEGWETSGIRTAAVSTRASSLELDWNRAGNMQHLPDVPAVPVRPSSFHGASS